MKTPVMLAAIILLAISEVQNYAHSTPTTFSDPRSIDGTGCLTADSIRATGHDTETLSLFFDTYEAGINTASRTTCDFSLVIHPQPGKQVAGVIINWQGFAQGQSRFKRTYTFAENEEETLLASSMFNDDGPGTHYQEQDMLKHDSTDKDSCGSPVELRVSSSMVAKHDDSYITANRAQHQYKTTFHVQWHPCL